MKDTLKFKCHPKYWPLWLAFGIFRLLVLLPYGFQLFLGKWLGRALGFFGGKGKRTAMTNIALCFPEMSEQDRLRLLKRNFESMGMFAFEVAIAFWGSHRKMSKIRFDVDERSLAVYDAALAKGKGVLFAGPHFASLEMVGRLISMRHRFAVMYRENKSPFLEHLLRPALERHYPEVVERRELKKFIRCLADNLTFWYAADVDVGARGSVFAPFFGIPTATMTAPARLSKKTGAVVLLVGYFRLEGGGYRLSLENMPEDYPSGDDLLDATQLNEGLEKLVREHPDQYFWQYKRFKTRPEGEARFYK